MATPQKLTVGITVDLDIPEKTVNKCLRVLDMWLEEPPDKTIIVEDEDGTRACLIAEVQDGAKD